MDQTEADGDSQPESIEDTSALGNPSPADKVDPAVVLDSAAKALENLDEPEADRVPEIVELPDVTPTQAGGNYSRTVLSIATPVAVVLARKKVELDRIVNLVPGSMLTFEAHCDEPLTLEAGGHPIARGETVKIGDKFGLRIRQVLDDSDDDYWTHH